MLAEKGTMHDEEGGSDLIDQHRGRRDWWVIGGGATCGAAVDSSSGAGAEAGMAEKRCDVPVGLRTSRQVSE